MKEGSSVTKGFMILSIAGIVSKLLSALYVPLLTRIIGDVGMGIYGKGYDVFMFVYAVTTMGCQPAVAKVISELKALGNEDDAERTLKISKRIFGVAGGIGSILLMILAYPIAKRINIESATFAIMFLGPSVFLTAILAAYRGYFQGKNMMHGIAISQVVEQILNVLVSLLCAYLFMNISLPLGAAGGTIGTTVGAVVAVIYLIYLYEKKIKRKKRKIRKEVVAEGKGRRISNEGIKRKIYAYALPITLIAGIQNFGGMVDMFNVNSRLLHAGFSLDNANALYGLFIQYRTLLGLPLIIITSLTVIILPNIAKEFALKNRKAIIKQINFGFKLTFMITIPAAVGMSFLSSEIYRLLFGTVKGSYIMMMGSFILIFMSLAQVQSSILQGMSKFRPLIMAFTIGVIFKVLGNYIFVGIPKINIIGVLIGNFFYFAIPTAICYKIIRRTVRYKIPILKPCIKPIIGAIGMGIFLYFGRIPLVSLSNGISSKWLVWGFILIYTIILVIIGSVIYGVIMIFIGGIRKADIEAISPKIYRKIPGSLKRKIR
ncbi:polysaccharide biosynthesis protein [uncultured Clostridium sp.]|uniref:putative polysaccharide biosynthesis protein n=1 Tax=uncultured Clostridium sp. TaxID=59620 RepID=UPI002639D957|nr:polysaccharide biosynthesis protein [uncultured Clostridium sp.]